MKDAGYSGTPLIKKLGIKADFKVLALGAPEGYWDLLGELPRGVEVKGPATRARLDFIHLFATKRSGLRARLESLKGRIVPNGMIWVSWPKKASGVETDVDGAVVRAAGLAAELVDIKVCAVDEIWSALKFVIPVDARD